MQEWIIAMLVVSILLILRDMAKTVFSGKTKEKEEMLPLCESHPQKEKVERYAASFRKLADTFYETYHIGHQCGCMFQMLSERDMLGRACRGNHAGQ